MATVMDLLAEKGSQVLSTTKETTVLDAAMVMNEHKVGALVVSEGDKLIRDLHGT